MMAFAKFMLMWTLVSIALGLIVGPMLAALSESLSAPPDHVARSDQPAIHIEYSRRSER